MSKQFIPIEKWIKTNEDWYPSYEPKKYGNPMETKALKVRMCRLRGFVEINGKRVWKLLEWRVCIWGADDFGMEKDVRLKSEARELFQKIKHYTTLIEMEKLGFIHA